MLLGIKENSEFDGLYDFKSVKIRDEIAKHFKNPILYYEEFKNRALEDFGIKEDEIKDGKVLINQFNPLENIMYYLALKGTNYDGVYAFKQAIVRDKFAEDVGKYGEVSNDKVAICKKYGISVEDIKDANVILYGSIRDSLKKMAGTSENKSVKNKKTKKEDVDKKNGKEGSDTSIKNVKSENLLKLMLSSLFKICTVAEVKLVTGESIYLTLKNLYYVQDASIFQNAAYMNAENKPCIKGEVIDKLLEEKKIGKLSKSKIEYGEGYAVITKYDDAYSPNLSVEEGITLSHQYSHIVLNVNQIVSVVGKVGYSDINLTEITPANYKLVYEYLNKDISD